MAAACGKFTDWLDGKLRELNADEAVFGSYITGIMESDSETSEEKADALAGLLAEITESDVEVIVKDIGDKWEECHRPQPTPAQGSAVNVEDQLAKLMEAPAAAAPAPSRQYTDEERRIREQILAHYSQTEVIDADSEDAVGAVESDHDRLGMSGIERNTNVRDVMQLQKEKREQARQDSAAKKQKDKEDREKQKQAREEKKEKRKTTKGERRR